eukprot:TRINITY_DN892_c0_g3_i1.p1 TRINITY_DN892_c0_g3~~TRINITY_DN892_c0_g3_i1.p1  ORF type:complete len:169 (+),score=50.39 TRINITY_DN892_c0_g3_i1:76-582(+)
MSRSLSLLSTILVLFVVLAVSQDALTGWVQGRNSGVPRRKDGSGNGCDGPDSNLTQRVLAWRPQTAVDLGWKGTRVPNSNKVSFGISSYPSKDASFTLGVQTGIDYNLVNYTYNLPDGLNVTQLYVLRFEWDGWVSCQDFYINPSYSTASSIVTSAVVLSGIFFALFL